MKRSPGIAVFFAFMLLVFFAGCGGGGGEVDDPVTPYHFASPPADMPGQIAFLRNDSQVLINANGTNLRYMGSGRVNGSRPSLSPDGRFYLYIQSSGDQTTDVWIRDLITDETLQLTDDPTSYVGNPMITADNQTIYFNWSIWGQPIDYQYVTAAPFGVKVSRAYYLSYGYEVHDWSINRDGTRRIYVTDYNRHELNGEVWYEHDYDFNIHLTNPSAPDTVFNFPADVRSAVLSHDGSKIAFDTTDQMVYIMNVDGTGIEQVPPPEVLIARYPCFSPDDTMIAYQEEYFDRILITRLSDKATWCVTDEFPEQSDTRPFWSVSPQ